MFVFFHKTNKRYSANIKIILQFIHVVVPHDNAQETFFINVINK